VSRNLSIYGGHTDEITCLAFSTDLEILLTGSIEGSIRIWNTVYEHLTCKIQEQTGRKSRPNNSISSSHYYYIIRTNKTVSSVE